MKYTESHLEEAVLEWFGELGYQIKNGPEIDPQSDAPERKDFREIVLVERLKNAVTKINPEIPVEAQEEAIKKVLNAPLLSSQQVSNNKAFYQMLRNGVDVEYRRADGSIAGDKVWLIDKNNLDNNDWLAVNQYTVIEEQNRRPDVVIFVNGLPLAIFELKNLADENVGINDAYNQIQTYKKDISSFFTYNQLIAISDGLDARVGTITSEMDRFMIWKTIDSSKPVTNLTQLEVLIRGIFDKKRFLDIISNFMVFEDWNGVLYKKTAAYHQYSAVNKALERTLDASSENGNRQGGVVWHTQGSGKSLTMVFYAGKLVEVLNNPTIVVLTDRNDLDDQLFGVFAKAADILRQEPKQAQNRRNLRELLKVAAGGIVFTTIQKFLQKGIFENQLLSDRRNIVVIADEAHRSQYDFIDGFAKAMHDALPNATFIGFTGTPIELADKSTRAVFGDYVDVYDISQAVEDHATVPIFYEARLAKIELLESERPKIDPQFEEITEGEEEEFKGQLASRWSRLEAMVGSGKRIELIAKDIVEHFENRLAAMDGKGMIVVMSRRIAVELYDEIIKLRPDWHSDKDDEGFIKVVMTGSAADPQKYQPHIRGKEALQNLADRMRDSKSIMKLAIVRDMWLTGFDVPSMHTMYLDKPMKGHGLMQAIARVNRVYGEKPGGLVVDYLGIMPELKEALANYSKGDQEEVGVDQEKAVSLMLEKLEIIKNILHGFDYQTYFKASPGRKTQIIRETMDFVLGIEDGEKRFRKAVSELSKAFALAVPNEKALAMRNEVGFFQAVRAALGKIMVQSGPTKEDYDMAMRQIIASAVTSNEVVDIFTAAGLDKPQVSLLSDEFLEEVKNLKHQNVALEVLRKILNDEIKVMGHRNVVKSQSFLQMLESTIKKYQNRTIEAAQVIVELINLAKEIRQETEKGKDLGLSDDEVAFYDALAENEAAILELGDKTLKQIAKELVEMLRKSTTIDWTLRENVKARIRIAVKKLLKKYDYPPDKQESATQIVLFQAETVCKDWGTN